MDSKNISIDELLTYLNDAPITTKKKKKKCKQREDSPTVLAFIRTFMIQPGEIRVPTYKIYHEYFVKWTGRRRMDKLGRHSFFKVFKKYFKLVRWGYQRYYLLNNCFDLSNERDMDLAFFHRTITKRGKNVKKK